MKVLASIGGWTYSKAMHSLMLEPSKRTRLVDSCTDLLLNQYGDIFDGLDIDLEYPCPPGLENCGPDITPSDNDKDYFTALMTEFRTKMSKDKILTIASSANPAVIPGMDLPKLNALLDWYNIMTYDFTSGSWGDHLTGHHAKTLKSEDPLASRTGFSAEEAGDFYVQSGAEASKINIGVAFYGRGFKLAEDASHEEVRTNAYVNANKGLDFGSSERNFFDYRDLKRDYLDQEVVLDEAS